MIETTAAGFLLPRTADATIRTEWAITPGLRVPPNEIRHQIVTSPAELKVELAEWREDFRDPAVWQRTVVTWPDGAVFTDAWSLADEEAR